MSTPTIVDDLTVTTYTKRHGQWFARVTGPEYLTEKLARQRAAKAIRAAKVAAGESLEPSFRVKTRVVSRRGGGIQIDLTIASPANPFTRTPGERSYLITEA